MKRTFLLYALVVVCCLCLPVAAQGQEYAITEPELIELERISQDLARDRLNQQLQASSLAERLKGQENKAKALAMSLQQAEQKANVLRSQLQTEREILKDLRQSYNAYEREAMQKMAEMQTVIDKQKGKIHRLRITVITLLTALIGVVVFALLKLKRFFPFLP